MSQKTNKSVAKRIKVTKNGKLKVRAKGRCHYNAKESNSTKMAKKTMDDVKIKPKILSRELPHAKL